jgi:hypothetical protein
MEEVANLVNAFAPLVSSMGLHGPIQWPPHQAHFVNLCIKYQEVNLIWRWCGCSTSHKIGSEEISFLHIGFTPYQQSPSKILDRLGHACKLKVNGIQSARLITKNIRQLIVTMASNNPSSVSRSWARHNFVPLFERISFEGFDPFQATSEVPNM